MCVVEGWWAELPISLGVSSTENARSTMKQRVQQVCVKWRQPSGTKINRSRWHEFIYGGECGHALFRGRLNVVGFEFKRGKCLNAKLTAGRISSEGGKVVRNGVNDDDR